MAKHSKLHRLVLTYKHVFSTLTQKAFTCSLKESFCLSTLLHKDLKPVAMCGRSTALGCSDIGQHSHKVLLVQEDFPPTWQWRGTIGRFCKGSEQGALPLAI